MKKLGFIGMGNMASAILLGAVRAGFLKGEETIAYDLNGFKLDNLHKQCGMAKASSLKDVIADSELILLAVKPKHVEAILTEQRQALKNKTLLSIAAGWQYHRLRRFLDASTHTCAIMPNTPAMVGEGMTIIEATHDLSPRELVFTRQLFGALGQVEELASDLMAIGGTLSGCAPAWVFMMIEALADGAVYHGLPRDMAYKLASQTVLGAGKMARDSGQHPAKLKDDVCSPGGITIRGLKALEAGGLRIAMMNAVDQAFKKPE